MKILVVDDDYLVRELIRGILREYGHEVLAEAADNVTALRLCEELHPDLVLLDINLRDSNGFELLDRLQASHPGLPVVMISAEAFASSVERARAKGARAFVVKPFNAERLMKAIERALAVPSA
jgi:CheY-like chemotaxis protein